MKTNKLLSMLLTLTILFSAFTIHVLAEQKVKVVLNGTELYFDVQPQLISNRTMDPMRKIFVLVLPFHFNDKYIPFC